MLALHFCGQVEGCAVPEVAVEERLGSVVPVVCQSGIRQGAYVDIAREHGARHGCRHPSVGVEGRL